jgi:hypothetical protein
MRYLGRIGLFAATIRRFLVNLRRQHRELFAELAEELTGRYVNKGDGVFSLVKPSEAARQMSSYGLLVRLLREQCVVSPQDEGGPQVSLKPPAEISPDSPQGPSDPDATYSWHKGKGYTAQVMEGFDPSRPAEAMVPNLITYADAEPAHVSNVHATLSAIEAVQQRGLGPQQLPANTLYGSDENVLEAKSRGVELVTPPAGGLAAYALGLGDTQGLEESMIDKNGTLVCCPQSHVPSKMSCARGETTV